MKNSDSENSLRENKKFLSVSVVIPLYNASSTILETLKSVVKQDYPIKEIIIIDNHSPDNSVEIVDNFKRKYKKINIKIIRQKKTYGISTSYNLGARLAKGNYIVTLHSDSMLPEKGELKNLIKPFLNNKSAVAVSPYIVHPKKVWLKYNFWQKCLFATVAGTKVPSMNGKFDCYKKSVFLKIGGYNDEKFNHDLGTEDADMTHRLQKKGEIIISTAQVVHLHGFNDNFSLRDWIERRRFLSFSYGTYLRMHAKDVGRKITFFLIKPFLVFLTILGLFNPLFFIPVILFPFIYMKNMFTHKVTLVDIRILTLPFIIIFLNYYETYWMIKGLILKKT